MSPAILKQLLTTIESLLVFTEEVTRTTAGACLGALCGSMDDNLLQKLLNDKLLSMCKSYFVN